MTSDRRKTLETLLEFALADDPSACWDPARSRELLRTQSTKGELQAIGAAPALLEELWPEGDER